MLKRIYIDNFRCLVNFELQFDSINLFLGENGSGKSTVFDVLQKIQTFAIAGNKANEIFRAWDCTRWQTLPIQSFELEIEVNGGVYKYELAIEHVFRSANSFAKVRYERLWLDSKPLMKFELGKVEFYDDNHSKVGESLFEPSQSILPLLSTDLVKLGWFRGHLRQLIIVQINPRGMSYFSEQEHSHPTPTMDNYVSWYRYLSQDQSKIFALTNALKEVLPGFTNFKFDVTSEQGRILKCLFTDTNGKGSLEYIFRELSDGQRMLIALYTLLYCTQPENYIICIDEPENFLALPEIQPWLIQLYDLCTERKLQALLISHHPELIDYLASSNGYWFERQSNTPVRVKRIGSHDDGGLPMSELVARGWLHV
jgi:energy-coupling factor transporter ATP-binding protein EcfA2